MGNGGVLYGTTVGGGASGYGTVFSMTPPAAPGGAWTENVLYNFTGGNDGKNPLYSGVAIGSGGVLYGTTDDGGYDSRGVVFSLTPPASLGEPWTEQVLHTFTGGVTHSIDGSNPYAGVVIGKGGRLYGTTAGGGPRGNGTVFELVPPLSPGGPWEERVIHSFAGGATDGEGPQADLVVGDGGELYGTTSYGGPGGCEYGCGTIFALHPPASPGGAWSEETLYTFAQVGTGALPNAPLVIGRGGVLYGTTYGYSDLDLGTVFSLTPPGATGGTWSYSVLHSFSGGTDGASPLAGVVIGPAGALYGTTEYGGTRGIKGTGTVYSVTPPSAPGGAWTERVLYRFGTPGYGGYPYGGVVLGSSAILYGTTNNGGEMGFGTAFSFKP